MIKIKEDIIYSKHADGSLVAISLIDQENSFYKMNGIAAECFEAIYNKKSLDDFKKEILKKYDVEEKIFQSDIDNLLNDLKTNNIIE